MTHYYFDVKNGTTSRDHAGAEFENDSQAIVQARIIAEEMSRSNRREACYISVIRDDGREVVQVNVAIDAGEDAEDSASLSKKSAQQSH